MKEYEINKGTLCLIDINGETTKIVEQDRVLEVRKNIHKIVDESCKNFGSSLDGRLAGTKKLTNITYKAPIILSEYFSLILFPTGSRRGKICHWICLNSIKDFYDNEVGTTIELINGQKVYLDISKFILLNQIKKATLLEHKFNIKFL